MKKKIRYLVIAIVGIASIVVYVGMHHIAPYAIIKPPRVHVALHPSDIGLQSIPFPIKTNDSLNLEGYWVNSNKSKTKGVIIMVHGIGGSKEHFIHLAKLLAHQGIASVLFDSRAHGDSEGDYCTYGYYEKRDIKAIVDAIREKDATIPIGIWGNSMGGAIALQALAYDNRLQFGVIESTFTDLHQIVYDYKKRMLKGIGMRSISNYVLKRAGTIAHFDNSYLAMLPVAFAILIAILVACVKAAGRDLIHLKRSLHLSAVPRADEVDSWSG